MGGWIGWEGGIFLYLLHILLCPLDFTFHACLPSCLCLHIAVLVHLSVCIGLPVCATLVVGSIYPHLSAFFRQWQAWLTWLMAHLRLEALPGLPQPSLDFPIQTILGETVDG